MKIIPVACPKCGASFEIEDGRNQCFCQYCGTKILLDDGSTKIMNTSIIRDEAKIKSIELQEKRLELEREKELRRQKENKTRYIVNCVLLLIGLLITGTGLNKNDAGLLLIGLIVVIAPVLGTIFSQLFK